VSREALIGTATVRGSGNRSLLRRLNSYGVLSQIRQEPHTVSQLASATGLSRTATESVVIDLVNLGWANPTSEQDPNSLPLGRPAVRYRFNQRAGHVATIDIGAHHIYAVVADLAGETVSSARREVEESFPASERLLAARTTLDRALADAGLSTHNVWVLTIGSPGAVDSGVVAFFGGSGMPGWVGLDISRAFSDYVDCPVLVEGDCGLGAMAEQWIGASQDVVSVVYILCGIRAGAAVLLNGRLHRGAHGGAGLVGELAELRWRELELEMYGNGAFDGRRPTREQIFKEARAGNQAARKATRDFAKVLALGAAAMVLAIDPDLVVIGGGSSRDSDLYLHDFTTDLAAHCPLAPEVRISNLGFEAVGTGGIKMAIEYIDELLSKAIEDNDSFPQADLALTRNLR